MALCSARWVSLQALVASPCDAYLIDLGNFLVTEMWSMIWNKIPAVTEWTACGSPIGAVTVSPALSSGSVLDCSLGLARPLLPKQIVRDAISPLAAVRVVRVCNLNHSESHKMGSKLISCPYLYSHSELHTFAPGIWDRPSQVWYTLCLLGRIFVQ